MSVKRLINSCVENPITLRINAVDEMKCGLSSDVSVNTVLTTSTTRFVDMVHSFHSRILCWIRFVPFRLRLF